MSRKEVPRAGLIKAALAGRITNRQGAAALHLSVRQFQRLKARMRTGGAPALRHRTRGQPSPRRLAPALQARIRTLMTTTYAGFNDVHLTEKLREVHDLAVSRESVRRLRRALGRPATRPRQAPRYRRRRLCEAAAGALVQVDGSAFAWFGDRGPTGALLGAIDDATAMIIALQFRPAEDLHGYAQLFHAMFGQYGLPVAVYGDRLNVFTRNDRHWTLEEELAGAQHPTHFGRMLRALGIRYIAAQSPQAKGRVERLWQTLQDRLVSELRVRGIATVEAAAAFLPTFITDFNRRFGRLPRAADPVWRRPPRDLALRLGCCYTRMVARDNTVRLGPRWVQLPPGRGGRTWAGTRVELRELLDGRVVVVHDERVCAQQPSPGPGFVLKPRRSPSADRRPARRHRPERLLSRRELPRLTPRTHTGRHALPTHPWNRGYDPRKLDANRRARAAQGMTLSRSSKG